MTAYHIGRSGSVYYAKPLPLSSSPSWASDAVTLTESGSSGVFSFDNDSTKAYVIYLRAGGSPASSDTITDTLPAAPSVSGGGSGEGAYKLTIPIRNSADDALAGARVSIVGTTLVQTTGTNGNAVFNVDGAASPGVTYTVRVMAPSGYVSPNDFTVTVLQVDKTADDVVLTAVEPATPSGPGQCVCTLNVRTTNGAPLVGAVLTARPRKDGKFVSSALIHYAQVKYTSNSSGTITAEYPKLGKFTGKVSHNGEFVEFDFDVANANTMTLQEVTL